MEKATAARAISQAEQWIGYLEKKSNKQLDEFTANAGKNNYTRFNRDYKALIGSGTLNMQWCAAFISMVFAQEFGLTAARALLGGMFIYTPTGAANFKRAGRYFKRGKRTPQAGDVVFFWSKAKGRIGHVGIVTGVNGGKVYTIEGNTSGANKLVTNGGGVCRKSYSLKSSYIDGYGRPPYDLVEVSGDVEPEVFEFGERALFFGLSGPDVRQLQSMLIAAGYSCGVWGADGEFGTATENALKAFEEDAGLAVDGVMMEADYRAMMALEGEDEAEDGEGDTEEDDPESPAADGYFEVITKSVFIRAEPSTTAAKAGVAYKGDKFKFADAEQGTWSRIEYAGGTAWITNRPEYTKYIVVDAEGTDDQIDAPAVDYTGKLIPDLSRWNGLIKDGAKLAAAVAFVIHRASVGDEKDSVYLTNASIMNSFGIPYGAYHYLTATNEAEAKEQAQIFFSNAYKRDPKFLAIDCEDGAITALEKKKPGTADRIVHAFGAELRAMGVERLGIYIGHHLVKVWNLTLQREFNWIPRYGKNDGTAKPQYEPDYDYDLWQFTSRGKVPGIGDSTIDLNLIHADGKHKTIAWFRGEEA